MGTRGPNPGQPTNKRSASKAGAASKGGGRPSRHGELIPFTQTETNDFDVPELPNKTQMLKVSRDTWELVWSSGIASQLQEQDTQALYRWIEYLDEWHRARRTLKGADRLVPGSRGQMVLNPLIDYMQKLEANLRGIEDRLGLSPMARARLGLTVAEGTSIALQINQQMRNAAAVERGVQDETVVEISEWKGDEETG